MTIRNTLTVTLAVTMAVGVTTAARAQTPAGTQEPHFKMTTRIPHQITTPDEVETPIGKLGFFDGVPIGDTREKVYDYVDRARAVQVFINMIPAVSVYHLRQGMRDIGLTGAHQILIAEDLGDSKPLVLTWNNTSLYTWGFLDLKRDGPTVIELPPGVLGALDDMYFRYIEDLGAAGPDKGKGGKYLVLPPGYEGDEPEGYFVVRSRTYGVWNFMRGYVEKGVQEAADRVKGQPFSPDGRMRRLLAEAVAIGNAYARANTVFPRDPGHRMYPETDSEWVMAFADKDSYFLKDGARRSDSRLWMHYNAVVVTPAMALTRPGAGSDYGIAGLDSEHRPLDGGRTYKLHVPPKVPVKDNWSVTIYDTQTRSMLQTDQQYAGLNSLGEGLTKNPDGSVDIYFAPEVPEGQDDNWIQTIPGKSWFIIFRAYGPLEPWLDKTWRPSELELVE